MTRALALLAALALSGCGKTVIDTSCSAFRIITYDAISDTPETRTQVREHNAAFQQLCPA